MTSSTDVQPTDLQKRLELFHELDFEGFNKQNWDLFRSLHTDDVVVEINGTRTDGIDPHVEGGKQLFAALPDTVITDHLIKFGDGEWTCTVSRIENMGKPESKLVTVARWRGDQVSEEYIFWA